MLLYDDAISIDRDFCCISVSVFPGIFKEDELEKNRWPGNMWENGWGMLIAPLWPSQNYSLLGMLTATDLCWSFQTCWRWQSVNRGPVPSSWDCRVSEGGAWLYSPICLQWWKDLGEEVVKALFHIRFHGRTVRWGWFWDWVGLCVYIYMHIYTAKYLYFKSQICTFAFQEHVWIAV